MLQRLSQLSCRRNFRSHPALFFHLHLHFHRRECFCLFVNIDSFPLDSRVYYLGGNGSGALLNGGGGIRFRVIAPQVGRLVGKRLKAATQQAEERQRIVMLPGLYIKRKITLNTKTQAILKGTVLSRNEYFF
jgi:hypothetical protein